jgi:P27 family predicted phage terminase small subunit
MPSNVHVLRGNPSKKTAAQLGDSLQPEIDIPGCPGHLLKEARKEWKRITPELERYGLISSLDRAALSSYCQSWALLVYVEQRIRANMERAEKKRAECDARGEEYVGGDGLVEVTSNGNTIYSPYWVMRNRAHYAIERALINFGLSPAARGRVSPSTRLQKDMFEDTNSSAAPTGFGGL